MRHKSPKSDNRGGLESKVEVKRTTLVPDVSLLGKLFRFAGVGAFSGLIYVITVAFCVDIGGMDAKWASAIGYLAALPVNFIAHKRITFRSRERPLGELLRFVFLHTANLIVSIGGMFFVVDWLGYSYLLGSALVVAAVPISTFIIMDLWVFKPSTDHSKTERHP